MNLRPFLGAARAALASPPLSPDGFFYLCAAKGEKVPRPFAYRWLLPAVLGDRPWRWVLCTALSLAALGPLAWGFFGTFGLDGPARLFAVALLLLLQGVTRTSLRYPVLTDAPGFALTLAAAWAARAGAWWAAGLLSLLAGATRESSPLFAALWAWHPLPLVGLAVVGWWRPRAEANRPWLENPVREALLLRRRLGLDGTLYVRPWGAAILGLALPSWQLGATLAAGYLQLLTAQDSIRLYQWAAPVLVVHAAHVLPLNTWPALAFVALALSVTRDDRV